MRTAARFRTTVSALAAGAVLLAIGGSAGAAPTAVDIQIDVVVGSSPRTGRPIPSGSTTSIASLRFAAGLDVSLITPEAASARVRLTLPDGLSWGPDLPDPTENCTSTASTGDCQTSVLEPVSGRSGAGWGWDVIASRPGSYVLRAEIVEASTPDPVSSNDVATVTVVVTETAPPPPPTPGRASASAAKLSPGRPKAGSKVVASVRLTAGGSPLRPSRVTCAATAGATKLKGVGRSTSGSATCTYRTPRSAKGKLLRGAISFVADGAGYTRRFSVKLG